MGDKRKMNCRYNKCKYCGFKSECEIYKENAELKETLRTYNGCGDWDNDFHTCRVYLQHEELQMYIHQLTTAKEIMQKLIANAPDTYSGTNIELQQKKMFAFQNAINKAEQFLSEVEK